MRSYRQLLIDIPIIEERLSYVFHKKELLTTAFIHTSFYHERKQEVIESNERMEFLGDSILGLLMAEYLYQRFPASPEGELAALQARLVDATMCARFVRQLHVVEFLLLGKGELRQNGLEKESLQADLLEAILAAVYIDGGLQSAQKFFACHFVPEILKALQEPALNWKTELQDFMQKTYQQLPVYHVLQEQGPDHSKVFEMGVLFEGKIIGRGEGGSKKEAEQRAAKQALEAFR